MEEWVARALARWPNVPALYGWLSLDRRGRWRIRGETISRPQIVDTIAANYAADARGCWYFQNGPQRGFVTLETAPLIARSRGDHAVPETHTGLPITRVDAVYLDEEGSLLLATEHGAAALADTDLDWALARLRVGARARPADEDALAAALAQPSGETTALSLAWTPAAVPRRVERLDRAAAPAHLGFVRDPQPPSAP